MSLKIYILKFYYRHVTDHAPRLSIPQLAKVADFVAPVYYYVTQNYLA